MAEALKKERKIIIHKGYGGACQHCGAPIEIQEVVGIELFDDAVMSIMFPFDIFYCPICYQQLNFIRVWKSLDVTQELARHD